MIKLNCFTRCALIGATTLTLIGATPIHAYACSNWTLSCVFGLDDIAAQDADRRVTENAQDNAATVEKSRIEAEKAQALRAADNALQVQMMNGQITRELADQQFRQYTALLDASVEMQKSQTDQNIAALQAAANVSIVGVQESGMTVRERLRLETMRTVMTLAVLLIGGLILLCLLGVTRTSLRKQKKDRQYPVYVTEEPNYYKSEDGEEYAYENENGIILMSKKENW